MTPSASSDNCRCSGSNSQGHPFTSGSSHIVLPPCSSTYKQQPWASRWVPRADQRDDRCLRTATVAVLVGSEGRFRDVRGLRSFGCDDAETLESLGLPAFSALAFFLRAGGSNPVGALNLTDFFFATWNLLGRFQLLRCPFAVAVNGSGPLRACRYFPYRCSIMATDVPQYSATNLRLTSRLLTARLMKVCRVA